jgi:hypothetical protein
MNAGPAASMNTSSTAGVHMTPAAAMAATGVHMTSASAAVTTSAATPAHLNEIGRRLIASFKAD